MVYCTAAGTGDQLIPARTGERALTDIPEGGYKTASGGLEESRTTPLSQAASSRAENRRKTACFVNPLFFMVCLVIGVFPE
jgi:hypothetical protein